MARLKKTLSTAVIVIPTYNEANTIGRTLDVLCTQTIPEINQGKHGLSQPWLLKILVVDANSPDGTGQKVEAKAKIYQNVSLLTETSKDGIGAAYYKGFQYAIQKLGADFVFEFDSDLQHPPSTIPLLLAKVEAGYDYVIGSRKIKGGSIPKGWGFKRVLFSELGGFVARFIMFFPFKNFWRVTDPTTGLKITRVRGFIDQMDLSDFSHLYSRSFGYKLQLLFETLKMGARFTEIPLQFQIRTTDESKIEAKTAKDIFRVAFLLRRNDEFTKKFIKFGLVGGVGFVINLVGLNVFSRFLTPVIPAVGLRNSIANTLASELSIISNFTFNNAWTFKSQQITAITDIISKFVAFNLSSLVGGVLVPALIVGAGTHFFGDQSKNIFLVIAILGFTIPYNWTVYNRVIWKKK
ncbi:MAG: glycosyltransferase [Candidatus Shapirobacteria bacterium]